MRSLSPLLLAALVGALPLAPSGAAETEANRPELAPAVPVRRSPGDPSLRRAPFANHWDSQSWDPAGGLLFWHRLSEKRRSAMPERAPARDGKTAPAAPAEPSGKR